MLSVLRKLKRYANHNRRKQLAEALILFKIDYALPVLSNARKMEIHRLQKVLNPFMHNIVKWRNIL